MSELKATPGEWIEGIEGNLRIYGPDGMGEHSGLIAQVYKGRENLKLMLASRDLYEALEQLDEAYCRAGCDLTREERIEDRKRLMNARAALAKARGESP